MHRRSRGRLGECDRDVLALHHLELRVQQAFDRIDEEQTDDEDRHGQAHAEDRERRPDGLAGSVSQDHAHGGRQAPFQSEPLDQRLAELLRRRRPHRFRGSERHDVPHRGQCADEPGGRSDEQRPDDEGGLHFVHERRELEEVVVELDHAGAQPLAEPEAKHRAGQRNDQAPAHVMPGQLTVGVTHRLERGNLLALHGHDAVERHIEEEGGDAQKNCRHDDAGGLQLVQLVVQEPRRHLQAPWNRAKAAVRGQQRVERGRDRDFIGARRQLHRHVVEAALHVEGGAQGRGAPSR